MNAQPCPRCGNKNPAEIHTCTPLALRLADVLEMGSIWQDQEAAAAELRRLHTENESLQSELRMEQTISFRVQMQQYAAQRDALLAVLQELKESAAYWSEYDVPLGIVDRINAAIAKAEGEQK